MRNKQQIALPLPCLIIGTTRKRITAAAAAAAAAAASASSFSNNQFKLNNHGVSTVPTFFINAPTSTQK